MWVAAQLCAAVSGSTGCSDDVPSPQLYAGPPRTLTPEEDGGAGPSWLIHDGDSVFFVGNSFFDYQGRSLPDWVAAVGRSVHPAIAMQTGSHIVPGVAPLWWFFAQRESQDAIKSGRYNVFILQGEETEPVDHKQDFQDAVRFYHRAITAHGGKVMLFMTWDFAWNKDNPEFFRKLSAAYEEIGSELGIPVIPVGLIWDDCNKAPFTGEQPYFLNGQDLHQTEKGSAANAYATFGMLTGVDPQGARFNAQGNTNSPELLQYLSDKAWFRVSSRLSPNTP